MAHGKDWPRRQANAGENNKNGSFGIGFRYTNIIFRAGEVMKRLFSGWPGTCRNVKTQESFIAKHYKFNYLAFLGTEPSLKQ